MNMLKTITLALAQYREFHAALTELRGASDRELAGRGLARGDVTRAAFETAERRVAPQAAADPARRGAGRPAILSPARA